MAQVLSDSERTPKTDALNDLHGATRLLAGAVQCRCVVVSVSVDEPRGDSLCDETAPGTASARPDRGLAMVLGLGTVMPRLRFLSV